MRLDPPPYRDYVAQVPAGKRLLTGEPGTMTAIWQGWIQQLARSLSTAVAWIGSVALTSQTAAIAATVIPHSILSTALYRVSYTARIVRPASVMSSLGVTISWVDGGVSCSQSGAALTDNTTAAQQNGIIVINADAGSSITYTTTYVSSGATTMAYRLNVIVESL